MPTILEIYESFHNGQKKQFISQVQSYGAADFARDIETEIRDEVLTHRDAFEMLQCYMKLVETVKG